LSLYRLVTVGALGEEIAAGAVAAGMPAGQVCTCTGYREAARCLLDLGAGDVVLFKGSRRAGIENVLSEWESLAGASTLQEQG